MIVNNIHAHNIPPSVVEVLQKRMYCGPVQERIYSRNLKRILSLSISDIYIYIFLVYFYSILSVFSCAILKTNHKALVCLNKVITNLGR